jgi:SAM-dependent methyltransferase
MSDPLEAAKLKAELAYNAAADYFDAEPLGFWARYGRRTVERLRLQQGAHVLDVGCGTGASALPAAQAVGPEGHVIAVDLAGELLKLGQAKAQTAGLQCVEFRRGDMTGLGFPDCHFDAVVCVFGIFFVPDMEHQVAELWRMVRPGGQLAITTWAHDFGVRRTRSGWRPCAGCAPICIRPLTPGIASRRRGRSTGFSTTVAPKVSMSLLKMVTKRCARQRISGPWRWGVACGGRSIRWALSWPAR